MTGTTELVVILPGLPAAVAAVLVQLDRPGPLDGLATGPGSITGRSWPAWPTRRRGLAR